MALWISRDEMAKAPTPPGRGSDQFLLRFPEGMRDRLAELAAANGRSMNAEVIVLLEFAMNANSQMEALQEDYAEFKEKSEKQLKEINERMTRFERDR